MKTKDFWYDLPEELIAQTPLEKRDGSRLMVLDRDTGDVTHKHFYDLIDYLQPGDCLVMNDSRVLPARLLGHRPTGGAVEVLLLKDDLSILLAKRKSRRNKKISQPGTESRLPEAVTVRQQRNILMPFLMISWNFMVTEVSETTMLSSAVSLHWTDSLLQ